MKRERKIRGEEEWKEGGVQMTPKGRAAADEHSGGEGGRGGGWERAHVEKTMANRERRGL